ncbi:hypothetical protein L0F63_000750 [Massospora cicadina]|nr:hypothetical protein L0F63_000750 [Massospora cicadina]
MTNPVATLTLAFSVPTRGPDIPMKPTFSLTNELPPIPSTQYILTYPTYLPTHLLLTPTPTHHPTYTSLGTQRPQFIVGSTRPTQPQCQPILIHLNDMDYRTLIERPDTSKWLMVALPQDLARILGVPDTQFKVNWIAPNSPHHLHLDPSIIVSVTLSDTACPLKPQLNTILAKDPLRLHSTILLNHADPHYGAKDLNRASWVNLPHRLNPKYQALPDSIQLDQTDLNNPFLPSLST